MVITQQYFYNKSKQDLPKDILICPRCHDRFEAGINYSSGKITCPNCGLIGSHKLDHVDIQVKTDIPTVKIIKDIRR
jgi:hypothetical protein